MNKLKRGTAILSLLFVIFAAARTAYTDCDKVAHNGDFHAEHDATTVIHCPEALLIPSIQAASSTPQSHRRDLNKAISIIQHVPKARIFIARFDDHAFTAPPIHQHLFQFLEVYRL